MSPLKLSLPASFSAVLVFGAIDSGGLALSLGGLEGRDSSWCFAASLGLPATLVNRKKLDVGNLVPQRPPNLAEDRSDLRSAGIVSTRRE